jgi:hypothetical protein
VTSSLDPESHAWTRAAAPAPPPFLLYVKALDLFDWSPLLPGDPEAIIISRVIAARVKPDVASVLAIITSDEDPIARFRREAPLVMEVLQESLQKCLRIAQAFHLAARPEVRVAVVNSCLHANWIAFDLYAKYKSPDGMPVGVPYCHMLPPHVVWIWHQVGVDAISVSLRSDGEFDCQEYAVAFGRGGGHASAAAFMCASYAAMMEHLVPATRGSAERGAGAAPVLAAPSHRGLAPAPGPK